MTLRNKIIKYTKKVGPPPTRAQYEHLLAMGRLRMKEYQIEKSDILNRISELFDDDLIRSNKELFIPTVDHAQYDQDISNGRKRIKYMDQHLKEINIQLNSMIDAKKRDNKRKGRKGRRNIPASRGGKCVKKFTKVYNISEQSNLNIPLRKSPTKQSVNAHLPNKICEVEISSSSDEEDKQLEVPLPEVPNQMKNSEEHSPSTLLSPFSLTLLRPNFRFDLQYKVRSNSQKPNIFSKEYEKYLIEIIRNIPDDEKKRNNGRLTGRSFRSLRTRY